MVFAPWVLQKMVLISKQQNITSIADFIAARYGKSQTLAVVVALICLVGVLPYIALQLKGIVLGVNLLIGPTPTPLAPACRTPRWWCHWCWHCLPSCSAPAAWT